MSTVSEVPVVGELNLAQRGFCEFRLEIDRPYPRGRTIEHEGGRSPPQRQGGGAPRIQSGGRISDQRLEAVNRILPIGICAKLNRVRPTEKGEKSKK